MLTPKQTRFVAEYVIDLNATQAAIRCGYRPKCAAVQGSRLLRNAKVRAAVQQRTKQQLAGLDLTSVTVLEAMRRQVVGDIRTLFDADGNLIPITQLRPADAALIAGFEVVIRNAAAGDGHTETVVKVRLTDRAKYVQMAAQHFALLTDVVRVDHDAERIQLLFAGRARAAATRKALTTA